MYICESHSTSMEDYSHIDWGSPSCAWGLHSARDEFQASNKQCMLTSIELFTWLCGFALNSWDTDTIVQGYTSLRTQESGGVLKIMVMPRSNPDLHAKHPGSEPLSNYVKYLPLFQYT